MKRYRESHDFYHVITGLNLVEVKHEILLKYFEYFHFGFPMNFMSCFFGSSMLNSDDKEWINNRINSAVICGSNCKFLLNIEWENLLDIKLENIRQDLDIFDTLAVPVCAVSVYLDWNFAFIIPKLSDLFGEFAKDAKDTERKLVFFCVLCATFASSASGIQGTPA